MDLFLLHHPYQGQNLESYDAMLELKNKVGVNTYVRECLYCSRMPLSASRFDSILLFPRQGLVKSVGVSNYGVQHLEGLKKAGRPAPSVRDSSDAG